ncbi:hypothetical protein E2C01_024310 [Portunus trituberculatus]|uniref:Uncharacterized protein n=1 Tax=Portunus trituberculatus TaxID=210409 RepID=A0A5B7ECD3_PORTR|nr:hypothetical protein [Portunus trituberculatus]
MMDMMAVGPMVMSLQLPRNMYTKQPMKAEYSPYCRGNNTARHTSSNPFLLSLLLFDIQSSWEEEEEEIEPKTTTITITMPTTITTK